MPECTGSEFEDWDLMAVPCSARDCQGLAIAGELYMVKIGRQQRTDESVETAAGKTLISATSTTVSILALLLLLADNDNFVQCNRHATLDFG